MTDTTNEIDWDAEIKQARREGLVRQYSDLAAVERVARAARVRENMLFDPGDKVPGAEATYDPDAACRARKVAEKWEATARWQREYIKQLEERLEDKETTP